MLSRLTKHSSKLWRYAGVSLITVPLTQVLFFAFYQLAGFPGLSANALAVTLAAIPGYLLNRSWVWQKTDAHNLTREVLPFWVLNLLGLVLSTLAVWLAENQTEDVIALMAVNVAVFGTIWLLKYSVINRWLFAEA